jgi:site-specific DNA-methyltransferase (adenine-specific)
VSASPVDLRCGDWRDALADVESVDCLIADPPYSDRTQSGHDNAVRESRGLDSERRAIAYAHWSESDVVEFVDHFAPRTKGWLVVFSDHRLLPAYERAFSRHALTTFQPLACFIPGMTVRLCGDGPSSWTVYLNVARPKALSKWGTLPGGYTSSPGERFHIGGKPIELMRAIVRDYSREGDLICDPVAGGASTLLAAQLEGRRAIGAELDPETFAKAQARIAHYPVDLTGKQTGLFDGGEVMRQRAR